MTNAEIQEIAARLNTKFGKAVGVDQATIAKCLTGIASLKDEKVEAKIKELLKFL